MLPDAVTSPTAVKFPSVSIQNNLVPLCLNTRTSVFDAPFTVKLPTSTVQSSLAPICIVVVPAVALVKTPFGEVKEVETATAPVPLGVRLIF